MASTSHMNLRECVAHYDAIHRACANPIFLYLSSFAMGPIASMRLRTLAYGLALHIVVLCRETALVHRADRLKLACNGAWLLKCGKSTMLT